MHKFMGALARHHVQFFYNRRGWVLLHESAWGCSGDSGTPQSEKISFENSLSWGSDNTYGYERFIKPLNRVGHWHRNCIIIYSERKESVAFGLKLGIAW